MHSPRGHEQSFLTIRSAKFKLFYIFIFVNYKNPIEHGATNWSSYALGNAWPCFFEQKKEIL